MNSKYKEITHVQFHKPVLVQQEQNKHLIPEWLDNLRSHDQQVQTMTVVMQQKKCTTPKSNQQVRAG